MPSWSELKSELQSISSGNPNAGLLHISNRKKEFIKQLSSITGRNTILYFSAFMHKRNMIDASINDKDMNAFMEAVHKLDKSKGLDLILHTPGGEVAATEQIIKYLKSIFDGNIRTIVPQMAMSAGSIIAVSSKSIMMGKQSCLGPFDPHFNNLPCQSVMREFYRAIEDVKKNPSSLGLWQTIISKLTPTFLTMCEQADALSQELADYILTDSDYSEETKEKIKKMFGDNTESKVHSRHFDIQSCKDVGLHIEDLEKDPTIQDLVLSIHHCCMILGEASSAVKIIENNIGGEYVCNIIPQNIVPGQPIKL